ncbi:MULTISPECIES: hypothetical protein [unclassified Nostoc]|uniref:hypothetical protein n=1 Tax=unclassified Nostoc TaxID=2593658 RepID=UPI00261453D8|nr:hypothetical protein [Nostoc sp. S13]MDF5739563.1 hypothetical protein [Nostoc sp. S13]
MIVIGRYHDITVAEFEEITKGLTHFGGLSKEQDRQNVLGWSIIAVSGKGERTD